MIPSTRHGTHAARRSEKADSRSRTLHEVGGQEDRGDPEPDVGHRCRRDVLDGDLDEEVRRAPHRREQEDQRPVRAHPREATDEKSAAAVGVPTDATRAARRLSMGSCLRRPLSEAHACSIADVAQALGSDPVLGLAGVEVAQRLALYGPNELARATRPPYARIALRQLSDPLVALLVGAALVSLAVGEGLESAVIAAIVVLNAAFGFVQEVQAARAVLALTQAVELEAVVVRDGEPRLVPASELVPGDLVRVREGDRVPADAPASRRASASRWTSRR